MEVAAVGAEIASALLENRSDHRICYACRLVCNVVFTDAGWSSSVARWAHNPEVAGSNPVPATSEKVPEPEGSGTFFVSVMPPGAWSRLDSLFGQRPVRDGGSAGMRKADHRMRSVLRSGGQTTQPAITHGPKAYTDCFASEFTALATDSPGRCRDVTPARGTASPSSSCRRRPRCRWSGSAGDRSPPRRNRCGSALC